MIGLLIFYCLFSMLFCVAAVDETIYSTKKSAIVATILHFFTGPILLPILLGEALMEIMRRN